MKIYEKKQRGQAVVEWLGSMMALMAMIVLVMNPGLISSVVTGLGTVLDDGTRQILGGGGGGSPSGTVSASSSSASTGIYGYGTSSSSASSSASYSSTMASSSSASSSASYSSTMASSSSVVSSSYASTSMPSSSYYGSSSFASTSMPSYMSNAFVKQDVVAFNLQDNSFYEFIQNSVTLRVSYDPPPGENLA